MIHPLKWIETGDIHLFGRILCYTGLTGRVQDGKSVVGVR